MGHQRLAVLPPADGWSADRVLIDSHGDDALDHLTWMECAVDRIYLAVCVVPERPALGLLACALLIAVPRRRLLYV